MNHLTRANSNIESSSIHQDSTYQNVEFFSQCKQLQEGILNSLSIYHDGIGWGGLVSILDCSPYYFVLWHYLACNRMHSQ